MIRQPTHIVELMDELTRRAFAWSLEVNPHRLGYIPDGEEFNTYEVGVYWTNPIGRVVYGSESLLEALQHAVGDAENQLPAYGVDER